MAKVEKKTETVTGTPAEIKPRKVFMGEVRKAGDLLTGGKGIALERMSDKAKIGYYTVPRFLMLSRVVQSQWDKKNVTIDGVDAKSGNRFSAQVPVETEFKFLTGRQGKEVLTKIETFQKKNLSAHVSGPLSRMIGADPEFFLETGKGVIMPAWEFLGSKEKPNKITQYNSGYPDQNAYWDGFQAEFTVHANTCMGWASDSFQAGLKALLTAAKKKDKTARLSTKTLIEVPLETLMNTKREFVQLGCAPSFNVYGIKGDLDKDSAQIPFRSTGGHIHFGIGKQSETDLVNIVKALDAVLAVGCVSMFENFDHPIRRQFYGQVGEYRTPPHGLEYRPLSNAWLFHPAIANLVVDLSRITCNFGINGFLKYWDATEEETIETVMTCDVKQARKILTKNKDIFKALLAGYYGAGKATDVGFDTFMNGMEHIIKDPADIAGNWKLNSTWVTHCDNGGKSWSRTVENFNKKAKA